jgi:hypothetical protein
MSEERGMGKQRGDIPDLAFGVFLILLAIVALIGTRNLSLGKAADMGPGYVPRALAWIILGLGLAVGVNGFLAKPRALPGFKLRPILSVLVSLAVFALLLPKGGLALATLGTMACSTFATPDYKWRESAIFAIVITAFTVLLFVNGLGLPLSVWPRW